MELSGGCRCGKIRYQLNGEPIAHALCHCNDCRKSSGAPMISWLMMPDSALLITQGQPQIHESSPHVERHFCGHCGTGLFYKNSENLPNIVDIQSASLDHPELCPTPIHIQTAERISWMKNIHQLPEFERFPSE